MLGSQHVRALLLHSQPPIITCPQDKTLSATEQCQALLPDLKNDVTTSDNCGVVNVTQNPAVGASLPLGDQIVVTVTAADAKGLKSQCEMTVTVVDDAEPYIDCGINDISPYDPAWHFQPCDASSSRPLQFNATVKKKNGCPPVAKITETTVLKCERCNGANKVETLTCNKITSIDKDTLQIGNTNGVGTFISWKVKASDGIEKKLWNLYRDSQQQQW